MFDEYSYTSSLRERDKEILNSSANESTKDLNNRYNKKLKKN